MPVNNVQTVYLLSDRILPNTWEYGISFDFMLPELGAVYTISLFNPANTANNTLVASCPFPRKKAETAAKIYEINEGKR